MTPAPEKATPIPVGVKTESRIAAFAVRRAPNAEAAATIIARAILQDRADREARPSLPDSREERIREDEWDRICAFLRVSHPLAADPLRLEGAMFPKERSCARQGGQQWLI